MKNLIFKSSFHEKLKLLIIPILLLTLGVGQMWGATATTLYYAIPASNLKSGDNCYTVKCNVNHKGDGDDWATYTMTLEDNTTDGKLIYKAEFTDLYDGLGCIQFQLYNGISFVSQVQPFGPKTWTGASTYNGKMWIHGGSSWSTKTADDAITVYFVNTDSWETPKAYAWSGCTNNAAWSGEDMASTDKTYNGKTIYSISFNKRYENIIFSNNGSPKTSDLTLGSNNAGKMYDNGTWRDYNYDVTVTFDANGHGTAPSSQTIVAGGKASTPTAPTTAGWTFGGWYKEAGCTNEWDFSTDVVTDNTTLYAKWTKISVSATVSPTSGTVGSNNLTFSITSNVPTDGGYYVAVYNFGPSDEASGYINGDKAYTSSPTSYTGNPNFASEGTYYTRVIVLKESVVQATSDKISFVVASATYNVNVVSGSATMGSVTPTSISTSASSWSGDITATPNAGYRFDNWTSSGGGITINGNTANPTQIKATSTGGTLTANFSAVTYRVTLDNQDATSAGTPYVDATYNTTTLTSITKPTKTNYTFGGYYTATGGGGTQIIDADGKWLANKDGFTDSNRKSIITKNKILYAKWTEVMSELTTSNHYDVGDPSYAAPTVSGSATTVGYVTTRTVTATPAGTGYTFTGWTLTNCTRTDGGAATATTITIRSNGDGAAATAQANYNEDLTTTWYIAGDASGSTAGSPFTGWGISGTKMEKKTGHSTEEIYYATITVSTVATDDAHFPFQTYNSSNDTYYGYNNFWITKEKNSTTVYSGNPTNMKFRPYVTGTYEFKLDNTGTDPVLTVTWPVFNQIRFYTAQTGGTLTKTYNFNTAATPWNETVRLTAGSTYWFKVIEDSEFFGNIGTMVRTNSSDWKMSNVTENCGITPDFDGDYTFSYDPTENLLSVTYPTAYTLTYDIGTVKGGDGSITSSPETASGSYVLSGNNVTLTAPDAKTGYTWKGWYLAADGSDTQQSSAKEYTVTMNADKSLYACYNLDTYTITYNLNGGTNPDSPAPPTSYTIESAEITLPTPTRTGYTFDGWYTNEAVSVGPVTAIPAGSTENKTYWAKWTAIDYPITYELNGGSKEGLVPWNPVTYTIEQNVPAFTIAPVKNGYTFVGWYTDIELTTPISTPYVITSGTTGAKTYYAKWTPITYTVTFDANGGTGTITPASKQVTYDAPYGELPEGPTPPGAGSFIGWYTASTGGTQVTAKTIVSTAGNHTLYARFESTFTVTVQYKCGSDVLHPQTTTNASEVSVAAEIVAPEILGYKFVNWTGDYATFADAESATTTVNVTAATTVVANYAVVPMVYFKNNLGWDDVYVSFDNTWNTVDGKNVPSNNGKPYYKMTQLGASDIYYCVIPTTYTANDYANWKGNIAFDNTNYGSTAETTHSGTWSEFYGGQFLGRGDFDPNATMYIPYDGDTETRNAGTYYPTGCWLQYNTNYSGYKVRVNTYVQGAGGSEVANVQLTSSMAGATEFTAKVHLAMADYTYGVMLYKDYLKNSKDLWYTNPNNEANTITSATTSLPWSWEKCDETWQRCRVKTESLGEYIFTVSFATGRPMVDIEYPVSVGDYRLVYKDRATWNIEHDANWSQTSAVFKKKANRVDTASFFVSYGSSPTLELQKCTAINPSTGAETWEKQGGDVPLTGIKKAGVYNFTVTQNADASSATAAYLGAYSGKFYVRTDVSDGGWNDYESSANAMTYTEYSMEHSSSSGPYSYYFMRHVNKGQNVKFVVANDYSQCLTDYMIDDDFTKEWIEAEANIRFTYNHTNNQIHRAYISGSSYIYDRFLVLEGDDKLFDADGNALTISGLNPNEINFTDDQNWIYETTVQAKPLARIKLTAKFNGKIQYFYGAEGDRSDATTYQLIGGTGETKYKMRVVYDFKTDRLLAAWLPNGDISDPTTINADVMIIRYHQEDAQQITFSDDGKLTDVKTVYGVMQFNKYLLNNQDETGGHGNLDLSPYERDLFFISFPFDVKLNDVFGFGQYGKHWIIEYYDGKTRAKNGYWKDSPTNWKFVTKAMKDSYTLKANEGYVLALDLDELKPESSVWDYNVENVYLYFPSTATVENIQATTATVEIDQTGYECTINRNTPDGDRRIKDSYWHLLGVPSYANASNNTSGTWVDESTVPVVADWTTSAPYVYNWNAHANKFGVISSTSTTFKPMRSYLAQYAQTTIEWASVNTTPKSVAARRNANYKDTYEFRLQLMQNDEELDHTFISLRDNEAVTSSFDFNYDLCKMMYGAFTSKSNIYTFAGNEEVAANCLPYKDETTIVPVGLTVDEEGEYIFSIPEGTNGVGVTLVDNERQTRTNLALTDYTVSLEKGTYDQRFVLEISPIEQIVTDVEKVTDEGLQVTGVCKKLIDGVLYIIKDGKVFDARGARIK